MKKMRKATRTSLANYLLVIVAFIVVQVLLANGGIKSSLKGQLVPICAYIVMAVSLNLVVGISGELSLGHAGFMSVGAFSGVVASAALAEMIPFVPLRLAIAMVVGAVMAAACGALVGLPVLRLRGDYLAIVTLAFGEIIKNIINIIYIGLDSEGVHFALSEAKLVMDETGVALIKGPMGAVGVTKISTFTAGFVLVLVTLFIVQNLVDSRTGRAILALRDNRIAAESVGLSVSRYKLTAFVTSAALAGAAGALYALNFSGVAAKKFDFNTSILVLVFVVLGGMGNIRGSVIAAALLTVLPELLRQFNFDKYRMLVYAIVLIIVMLVANNPILMDAVDRVTGIFKKKSKKGGDEA